MSFVCPECSTPKALKITSTLELPPDSRSDEITVQVVECSRCNFAGIAVYEESRRGALDSESFEHTSYRIAAGDLHALRRAIAACPTPNKLACNCHTHQILGGKDASGRWNGLADLHYHDTFMMRL